MATGTVVQQGEVVEIDGDIGVVGAQQFLIDDQCPLQQAFRLRIIASGALVLREIAQRRGDFSVGGTVRFFGDFQRVLRYPNGIYVFRLPIKIDGLRIELLERGFLGVYGKNREKQAERGGKPNLQGRGGHGGHANSRTETPQLRSLRQ